MTLRCKEGDFAIVEYDDPPCIANVGQVVRVIGQLQPGVGNGLPSWLIEPLSADVWYVANYPSVTEAHVVKVGSAHFWFLGIEHADKYLRPIRETGFDTLADVVDSVREISHEV